MRKSLSVLAVLLLTACVVRQRQDASVLDTDVLIPDEIAEEESPGEEPFILGGEQTDTGTTIAVRIKPGVPYIVENPSGAKLCMDDPVVDAQGTATYPIAERYAHLPMLGQLLTAQNCGPARAEALPTVENGNYTAGSTLWLTGKPSSILLETLKRIGYICNMQSLPTNCTAWRINTPVDVDVLAELKPFVDAIKKEECVTCK